MTKPDTNVNVNRPLLHLMFVFASDFQFPISNFPTALQASNIANAISSSLLA
jgi:hypothetical protein